MNRILLGWAGIVLLTASSWADTLRLKDGRKEEVTILGINARTLEVEAKAGGG